MASWIGKGLGVPGGLWVLSLPPLLAAAVVGLPLLLKDDGTAKGLVQILLTYTLSAMATLLGFATLWLSCGTLARDVEECQMQMVAVKPIARWQIWLGKWLGLLSLDAVLLALAGAAIFFLLQWRADRLPDRRKTSGPHHRDHLAEWQRL